MKKYIKLTFIIISFLLLFLVGCEKKELKKVPPPSELYSLYLSKTDKETIEHIKQYGEIVNLEVENYFLEMNIIGDENESEQKIKKIDGIEGVERIIASHPKELLITVE